MSQTNCESGSCKLDDRIWGIVNRKSNTLHRLTFSKSLADMLADLEEGYSAERLRIVRGKLLAPGDVSETKIYLIVSHKGIILRATLSKEIAELYHDPDSRDIYEGHLAQR